MWVECLAGMVLCFEFVTKTVLMTHQCFDYCWAVLAQCQHYLLFQLPPQPVNRIGVYKKQGGSTTRTANPKWPNGYSMPYVIISSKTERKGILGKVAIARRLARDWSTCGRWQVPLYHLFFVCLVFLPLSFTYKTISSFLAFALPILPPVQGGTESGSEQATVWCLAAYHG